MLPALTPRPEQEAAIVEVLESKRHLCRAATGAGKTLIGVEAVLRSKVKITLVIAPINTFAGWRKTFERQSKGKVSPLVIDGTKAGKAAFGRLAGREPGVYLLSWERFRMYDWSSMPLGFVIADEVHRACNRKAVTATAPWTTRHAAYALALSGTPWGNRIEGAWSTLKWLWWGDDEIVGRNQGFWNWVSRHLTTELDQYAGKKITGEREQGSVWASVPSRSYFPSPYQVEPVVHLIEVDLTAYQRKVYDRFEQEAIVWLEDNPLIAEGGGSPAHAPAGNMPCRPVHPGGLEEGARCRVAGGQVADIRDRDAGERALRAGRGGLLQGRRQEYQGGRHYRPAQ